MKKVLLAFAALLIATGAIYFTQKYVNGGGTFSLFKNSPTATIDAHIFKVIVAASQQDRELGLSNAKSLAPDQGMIFLFDKPDFYSFWMKNMKFPIDIIYINSDTIVTIKSNVQPPKNDKESSIIYTPTEPANKVLEIQAGLAEKYNFKNGDKVTYENLGN